MVEGHAVLYCVKYNKKKKHKYCNLRNSNTQRHPHIQH